MPTHASSAPNLFIVGAPKCGTNSLHAHLAAHPDVFMSPRKEPRFYDRDLPMADHFRIGDRDAYLALFKAGAGCCYRGEASPLYLYSAAATQAIHDDCPDARIIIMLRQPVDLMISMHRQNYRAANEDLRDFADAIDAEADRRAGERLPADAPQVFSMFYRELVDFVPHIQRYRERFGRERVHIMLLDDLRRNARAAYEGVLRFLDLDESHMPDSFDAANVARDTGGRGLFTMWNRFPIVRTVGERLTTRGMRRWVRESLTGLLPGDRLPDVPSELYAKLLEAERDRIDALATEIDRDLSHWHRVGKP